MTFYDLITYLLKAELRCLQNTKLRYYREIAWHIMLIEKLTNTEWCCLLVHGFNQLRDVGYFIVQVFGVHVVTKQQTSNTFLVHLAAHCQVRQGFLNVDLEVLLARVLGQVEELRSGTSSNAAE